MKLLLVVAVLALTSCATFRDLIPVVQNDQVIRFDQGRRFVFTTAEVSGGSVRLGVSGERLNWLELSVSLENNSPKPISILSENIEVSLISPQQNGELKRKELLVFNSRDLLDRLNRENSSSAALSSSLIGVGAAIRGKDNERSRESDVEIERIQAGKRRREFEIASLGKRLLFDKTLNAGDSAFGVICVGLDEFYSPSETDFFEVSFRIESSKLSMKFVPKIISGL